MKYVELGGREASVIGLGLSQFGSPLWGWGSDGFGEDEAHRIVGRALDLGINVFDTAEHYSGGRSEEVLGSALAERRAEAIVATKISGNHLTYRGVLAAAERSLARLGTETIELYQIHWPNRFLPIGWSMRAMRELQGRGQDRRCRRE